MATLTERRNSKGELTGWKVTALLGRDETYRQVWKTTTIKVDDERITIHTPKKRLEQVQRIADTWAEEQKAEYEQNGKPTEKVSKDKVTLANFIRNKWLPLHVHNGEHTSTTTAFYENMATDIISYFGEHIQLSKIDGEIIAAYQIAMRTKLKTKQGNPYSETTIRRHLETLRNILQYSKAHKYIKSNPFEEFRITTSTKAEQNHIDYLTPAEAAAFIEALSSENLQWQCFMRILLYCGLRRGECTALQWHDIDFEHSKITVRQSCTVDSTSKDGFTVGSTKSGKIRSVYITKTLVELLKLYQDEQAERYGEIEEGFLFHTPKDIGRPLYPTSATTWLSRFMKKNNMRPISPHDLRHSCGTLQKMAGISIKDIATFLGHSDTKTTNKFYVEADNDTQRHIGSAIEKLIDNAQ